MIGLADRPGSPDDRAVSDVLAFILVFSIIITSAGLVYTFGMGALDDAQISEQNRNAERAFETLSMSFNDLQTGRGEERMSQLNPRGGQVSVDDETQLTVRVNGTPHVDGRSVGSLNYDHEGTEISYELGAAFRADDGHSVMVREPEFVCTSSSSRAVNRSVVSYPVLNGNQPTSVSTSSTLRIRAATDSTSGDATTVPYRNNESIDNVSVRVDNSAHADAWERYFDRNDNGWEPKNEGTNHVEAACETDDPSLQTFVRKTIIEVELL